MQIQRALIGACSKCSLAAVHDTNFDANADVKAYLQMHSERPFSTGDADAALVEAY